MAETEPTPIEGVKEPEPPRFACGLSLKGIRQVIDGVENSFRGRPEWPFSADLKDEMVVAVVSCRTKADAEAVMRDMARASVTKRQRMAKGAHA